MHEIPVKKYRTKYWLGVGVLLVHHICFFSSCSSPWTRTFLREHPTAFVHYTSGQKLCGNKIYQRLARMKFPSLIWRSWYAEGSALMQFVKSWDSTIYCKLTACPSSVFSIQKETPFSVLSKFFSSASDRKQKTRWRSLVQALAFYIS